MPDPTPPAHSVPSRSGIWLNIIVQIAALLFVVAGVNVLSNRRFQRWDWSSSESFTLSGSTLNYLRKLGRGVDITVLVPRASRLYSDLQALTEEYRRNGKGHIKVEFVDPLLDLDRTEQLKLERKLSLDQSGVLVRVGDRQRFIKEEELQVLGQGLDKDHPSVDFRGEDAITTAMVTLIDTSPRKLYVLVGKGGDAATQVQQQLEVVQELGAQLGFESATLDLGSVGEVPKDATGLLLCGLHYDLTEREVVALSNYWNGKRSSLLLLLDPSAQTPLLEKFLRSVGVQPRGDRVLYAESTSTGPKVEFTVHAGFSADSAITRHLSAVTTTLAGQSQSLDVRDKDENLKAAGLKIQPLMAAAERYWGESNYVASDLDKPDNLPVVDAADTKPPVILAASVERGAVQDERLRVDSARMVVVANASLMDKQTRLAENQDFLSATLAWMTGRERLIGVPAKRKEMYRIQLSEAERSTLFAITGVAGPAAVLLLGLLVWAHRRAS